VECGRAYADDSKKTFKPNNIWTSKGYKSAMEE